MFKRAFHQDAVLVMGLYNIAVGVLVFFLYERVFILFGLRAYTPERPPAIQIPCLFLVVFGIGYALAYRDLVRNRVTLFIGALQNAAVTGAVVYYHISAPKLVHPVYYLPAGLSALFAIFFLVAWFGALVDAGRQRRQDKRLIIKPAPRPASAGPRRAEMPSLPQTEPPEEEPSLEEALGPEEEPERGQPPHPPEPEPPPESLAHRDRSGIPPDETPGAPD
jgi:hypothetical protein